MSTLSASSVDLATLFLVDKYYSLSMVFSMMILAFMNKVIHQNFNLHFFLTLVLELGISSLLIFYEKKLTAFTFLSGVVLTLITYFAMDDFRHSHHNNSEVIYMISVTRGFVHVLLFFGMLAMNVV
jgi:hypothetical protein